MLPKGVLTPLLDSLVFSYPDPPKALSKGPINSLTEEEIREIEEVRTELIHTRISLLAATNIAIQEIKRFESTAQSYSRVLTTLKSRLESIEKPLLLTPISSLSGIVYSLLDQNPLVLIAIEELGDKLSEKLKRPWLTLN